MTASLAGGLSIAVESDGSDWVELTDSPDAPPPVRIRASSLGEAATAAARSTGRTFVDIQVHVADTVRSAFGEYAAAHPHWSPGARTGTIVHPGTVATLSGLLRDIEATRVAAGVTLRGSDADLLARIVVDEIAPSLGLRLRESAPCARVAAAG